MDAVALASNWQTQSGMEWIDGDFDGDGDVDDIDATIYAANFGASVGGAGSVGVPEPSGLEYLAVVGAGIGAYGLMRRRSENSSSG